MEKEKGNRNRDNALKVLNKLKQKQYNTYYNELVWLLETESKKFFASGVELLGKKRFLSKKKVKWFMHAYLLYPVYVQWGGCL